MNVSYYIDKNEKISFNLELVINKERYHVTWEDTPIGALLGFILNSSNPLLDLLLDYYDDSAIFEITNKGATLLDIMNGNIDIKDTEYRNDYLFYDYDDEKRREYIKEDADNCFEIAEEWRNKKNKLISLKESFNLDINFEQKRVIKMIVETLLLESIYEDKNNGTLEKRAFAFFHADNEKYEGLLNYNCTMSVKSLCSLINDDAKWFNTIRDIRKNRDFNYTVNALNEINDEIKIYIESTFPNFIDFIKFILSYMLQNNILLKKCSNCNKYFYPEKRSDAIFCDDISPQDDTKTCKEYGRYINQQNKIKETPTLQLRKQIYNKFRNQYNRDKTTTNQERLNDFMNKSDRFKNDVKHNVKSESEYLQWLENVKNTGEV